VEKEERDMQVNAGSETGWGQETLRLLFVGLAVWIVGSVAAFALLSNAGILELSGTAMRAVTLLVGFALGALALLSYGALRFLNQSATVAALCAAAGMFLLPPLVEVVWRALSVGEHATLAPGLLVLLLAHVAVTAVRALRSGRRVDRILVPEAALLLLGLGLVMADLGPTLAVVSSIQ
jgi:hypothetical protein